MKTAEFMGADVVVRPNEDLFREIGGRALYGCIYLDLDVLLSWRDELRLRELAQLFNSLDPSPFLERDLDADAEEFIVGWASELSARHELALTIHLAVSPPPERAAMARRMMDAYLKLDCRPTWTCAPYQADTEPNAVGTAM